MVLHDLILLVVKVVEEKFIFKRIDELLDKVIIEKLHYHGLKPQLIRDWRFVVGSKIISDDTIPLRILRKTNTLVIGYSKDSVRPYIEDLQDKIIERVNSYYGCMAVRNIRTERTSLKLEK